MKVAELLEKDLRAGLYLCTHGSCRLTINGKPCRITYGQVLIKTPLIWLGNIDSSSDFEFTTILENDIEYFAPIASGNVDIMQNLFRINQFNIALEKTEIELLLHNKGLIEERKKELAKDGLSEQQQKLVENIIVMLEQVTVLEFVRILLKLHVPLPSKQNKENDVFVKFIFMLFRLYKRHRQVGFYADALQISPNHFTRIVKKVSRRAPSEWIALVTINQAKKLLRVQNVRIKDVAQELQFPEQFTFRKYFKRHTGMSPIAFKNKL